jgi:hypothetical protein
MMVSAAELNSAQAIHLRQAATLIDALAERFPGAIEDASEALPNPLTPENRKRHVPAIPLFGRQR